MDANKNGVPDWNEAAALEYLGPNGINNAQQAQISCESRFQPIFWSVCSFTLDQV